MRIRSIRPEFWSSEDISALSNWDHRLVFIGLWSYVDDNGVGRDIEKLIVADLFPLEDQNAALKRTHGALSELSRRGLITRYVAEGKPYLLVTNFDVHQVINRKSQGRYPLPTSANAQATVETHDTLTEDSVSAQAIRPIGEGEKGRRGEGEKARATRIPDDFSVTDDMRSWALEHTPGVDVQRVTAKFVDYWRATPGARGVKLDWIATWRNWLRREDESGSGGTQRTTTPSTSAWDKPAVGAR